MISSLSIVFLVTCYFYFKQHYTRLIEAKFENNEQKSLWFGKLTKKLKTLLFAVVLIVILYGISYLIVHFSPTTENVKSVRRVADIVTVIIAVGLFFIDKKELDAVVAVKSDSQY